MSGTGKDISLVDKECDSSVPDLGELLELDLSDDFHAVCLKLAGSTCHGDICSGYFRGL